MRNNNCLQLELWIFLCLSPMLTTQQEEYLVGIDFNCSGLGYNNSTPVCGRIVGNAIPPNVTKKMIPNSNCEKSLLIVMQKDKKAYDLYKIFDDLLTRYDCSQPYSIKFNCTDCREVYRKWVCSTVMEYWAGNQKVKPCRSVCHEVEQKCPFFLPLDKSPAHYAGEPSFLCLDPFIEETEEQRMNSMYSEDCCYEPCNSTTDRICLKGSCTSPQVNETAVSLTALATTSSSVGPPANYLILQLTVLTNYLYYFKLSVTYMPLLPGDRRSSPCG